MRMKVLPSAAELRSLLRYDADTGYLFWLPRPGNAAFNGRDAGRRAGYNQGDGSRGVRVQGVNLAEHRVIWKLVTGEDPVCEIDHVNGQNSDNRWVNLREAGRAQNLMNTRARGPWPKGVCFDKSRGLFAAKIKVEGRTCNLGRFSTPEAAAARYREAAGRVHGRYACFDR